MPRWVKKFIVLTFAVLASFAGVAEAGSAGADEPRRTPAGELEWAETPFGPLASPVQGAFATGEHVTLIKFPAGMKTPVHTHSADYVGIVVSGTTRHYLPGEPETKTHLPVGSHWFMPASVEHISECLPDSDCVMAIYQSAAFDFLAVD